MTAFLSNLWIFLTFYPCSLMDITLKPTSSHINFLSFVRHFCTATVRAQVFLIPLDISLRDSLFKKPEYKDKESTEQDNWCPFDRFPHCPKIWFPNYSMQQLSSPSPQPPQPSRPSPRTFKCPPLSLSIAVVKGLIDYASRVVDCFIPNPDFDMLIVKSS